MSNITNINNMNKKYFNNQKIKNNLNNEKLKTSTDNLESVFIKNMLSIAYKDSNIAGSGPGNDIIKDMYLNELSKSGEGSLGISKMIYENLKRVNNDSKIK